jgi:hypothetical protein
MALRAVPPGLRDIGQHKIRVADGLHCVQPLALLADRLADWSECALDLIDRKGLAPHREVAGLTIPLSSLNVVGQLGCFGSATPFRDSDEPAGGSGRAGAAGTALASVTCSPGC